MNDLILLSAPYFAGNEKKYVNECMESEWVSTSGRFVSELEDYLAGYVSSAGGACACVNGTSALHISLLLSGVKPGEEIIVPTLTFIAPINVVRYLHCEPVFIDCDSYMNMDPAGLASFLSEGCEQKGGRLYNKTSGRRIAAVVPVHIFGSICQMEQIMDAAAEHNLPVIEDATEALGSKITSGRYAGKYAGTIGDFGCFSFNGNKIITCGGGGMIVSEDPEMIRKSKYLTTQAKDDPLYYVHNEVGYNYRLTAVQAAIGLGQIEQIDNFIAHKKASFEKYKQAVSEIDGLRLIEIPDYCDSNYWFYSLFIEDSYPLSRDDLIHKFKENNIQVRPIWNLNHHQKPYRSCQAYNIEKAEYFFEHIVNLPCSSNLRDEEIQRVCYVLAGNGQK
ncbi:Putative pyridoxal phosphate-dependent aminotransferase EpsN [Sedimentisphaera cyanobacteriorum]|uniref:Pyridoxal phosphate-dependent aminotransferase EpsN n=1 Tax=Sedimentisphaera cyanobacteriorum TaxID=1940790 RepID=A0A1Q2HNV3_9BACT|nr:LegC family aminotransferase [Sedimentisphaera cyanobacteriorum]AQQ09148.1 Putative pyridoxal phosphate-dependent aminotransferase EpsN [Sedimentisphaera cyanobacteriorum]